MEVRATKAGFYESLRQPGDVFHVPDGLRASWFTPVMPEGLNPLEPDNHAADGDLGADGLNPNSEGLNPEPQWVEPTPEAKPETDNKPRKPNKQENLK